MMRDLKQRFVDGLILCSLELTDAHRRELERAAVPVVVIGGPPAGTRVDTVRADSRKGAAEAVRHLHAVGRRRIAFVNGPPNTAPGRSRRAGYLDGLRRCGLERDDDAGRGRRRLHGRARSRRLRAPARAREARRDLLRQRPPRRRARSRRSAPPTSTCPATSQSWGWTTRRSPSSPGRR